MNFKKLIRKFCILFFILLIVNFLFAQKKGSQFTIYSTIGLKGTSGLSIIKNGNIKADNSIESKTNSFYYSYGGKFSINYMGLKPMYTLLGFHFDYLFSSYSNKFNNLKDGSSNYNKDIRYKNNNLVAVFRYTSLKPGIFFEVGAQFTNFRKIKETNTISDSLFYSSSNNYNFNTYYKPYSSFVIGVGTNLSRVFISLRFTKSFQSIMNSGYTPVTDGLYNNAQNNPDYSKTYLSVKPTDHFTIQFTVEYYIPFIAFGRASCGGKGFSLFKGVDSGYYWGRKNYMYQ